MYSVSTNNIKYLKKFYKKMLIIPIFPLLLLITILIVYCQDLYHMDSTTKVLDTKEERKESTTSDKEYSIYHYSYQVNNKKYTCSDSGGFFQTKTILYNSKNPYSCMTSHKVFGWGFLHLFLIVPIVFMSRAITQIINANKNLKNIKYLQTSGKLVKTIPCIRKETGLRINNKIYYIPTIEYMLPTGIIKKLKGLERHNPYEEDTLRTIDLLIDENNPKIYYIDNRIDRITGNTDQDYYQGKKPE